MSYYNTLALKETPTSQTVIASSSTWRLSRFVTMATVLLLGTYW